MQKREYISAPQGLRNARYLSVKGAGSSGAVWNVRPFQIVSLYDMTVKYSAWEVNFCAQALTAAISGLGNKAYTEPGKYLDEADCKFLKNSVLSSVNCLNDALQEYPFEKTKSAIEHVISLELESGSRETVVSAQALLEVIKSSLEHDLQSLLFFVLDREHAGMYDPHHAFGDAVFDNFPSARLDVREARNCYALGRNTACVFHLMRAVEHPLRALAKRLKVSAPKKHPKTPLELRTWGDVIGKITLAINAQPNPKTKAQAKLTTFYNEAADQFQFFKDAWRDAVMHSRAKPYWEGEAKDLMLSVETFMRRLAKGGLKE